MQCEQRSGIVYSLVLGSWLREQSTHSWLLPWPNVESDFETTKMYTAQFLRTCTRTLLEMVTVRVKESYFQTTWKVNAKWLLRLEKTTSIAFDSVECVIFVFCNWYLRKPDDRPVYRTYFSELLVFVKCKHVSNALREENPRKKTIMSFLIFDFCHYKGGPYTVSGVPMWPVDSRLY